MTMEEMQRLLERQQSRTDIMNLMGRYQYYHTGGQMSRIGRELFAWWLPDARCEYGPLGVFGAKKSLEFFDAMTELFTGGTGACHPGLLEIHQITTPVLEVAEDNQTAKGLFQHLTALYLMIAYSTRWRKERICLMGLNHYKTSYSPFFDLL